MRALICAKIQGAPIAARPTITKSQSVSSYIRAALAASMMSPLPMTGMLTARLTAAIMRQSAGGAYICARVRAWSVTAAAPASSHRLASSTALMESASQPVRILTVTGQSTAATVARTISAARAGSFISRAPPPEAATLGAGHPMLMSRKAGRCASAARAAAATVAGSEPNNWIPTGRSPSVTESSSCDFRSPRVTALALMSSVTV